MVLNRFASWVNWHSFTSDCKLGALTLNEGGEEALTEASNQPTGNPTFHILHLLLLEWIMPPLPQKNKDSKKRLGVHATNQEKQYSFSGKPLEVPIESSNDPIEEASCSLSPRTKNKLQIRRRTYRNLRYNV